MRILILSAPFGGGHRVAGEAVAGAVTGLAPGSTVRVLDMGAGANPLLAQTAKAYLRILRVWPGLYRKLYWATSGGTWFPQRTRGLVQGVFGTSLRAAIRQEVAQYRPDVILATHPFPGAAAAALRRKGLLDVPLVMGVTDFTAHGLCYHPGVDWYCVAVGSSNDLIELGARPDRIVETGIPIKPSFQKITRPDTGAVGNRVLVMGGSLGMGPLGQVAKALLAAGLEVTVVCGHNQVLQRSLTPLAEQNPSLKLLGYTANVPNLMASSDLLITKPGGVSCSEALAVGLPIVLLSPLPGHEEENARRLEAMGVAIRSHSPNEAATLAAQLLSPDGGALQWSTLARRVREAGRADAANSVARVLLASLQESQAQVAPSIMKRAASSTRGNL